MRNEWRIGAGAALAVIALTMAFALVPGINACAIGSGRAWVTLQEAQTTADVEAVIQDQCADRLLPALRISMGLDGLAFVPAYGVFLLAALWASRLGGRKVMGLGLFSLATGVMADEVEGLTLLGIINLWPTRPSDLAPLMTAWHFKVGGLGVASLLIGVNWVRAGGHRVVGGSIVLGALLSLTFRLLSPLASTFGLTLAWLSLAAAAGWKSVRRAEDLA
jgi:hypothetical protein